MSADAVRIPFHRFADIFPMLEGSELRDLAEDIRLKGVIKPIDILDRAVLDGRNRHDALILLLESGVPRGPGWGAYEGQPLTADDFDIDAGLPWFRKYSVTESGDPLDYVWSLNFQRRHLTASQRGACAAEYEGYRHGGQRAAPADHQAANLQLEPNAPAPAQPQTRADRAEKHGVSERTLADADKVHAASPELHQAVKAGDVTADVAATLVDAKQPTEVKALIDALPRDPVTNKLTSDAKREVRKLATELKQERNEEKKARRGEREREQGAMQLAAPGKYGLILADPEHDFVPYSRETGQDRSAVNHYETSALETIMARRALIDELAVDGDVVLGLWITDLANGMKIAEAWGFKVVSFRVWVKDVVDFPIDAATLNALKLPERRYLQVIGAPGTGYWGRSRAELMLICVRGKPACPSQGLQGENVWFAARPHHEGTNQNMHSAKPEETAHDWFDEHFPSFRKVELNARIARPGWDRWGLEAPRGEGWIGPVPVEAMPPNDDHPATDDDDVGEVPPMAWAVNDAPDQSEHPAPEAQQSPPAGEPVQPGA